MISAGYRCTTPRPRWSLRLRIDSGIIRFGRAAHQLDSARARRRPPRPRRRANRWLGRRRTSARRTDFCTPPKDIPIAAAIALNGTPDARILATSASPAIANAADRRRWHSFRRRSRSGRLVCQVAERSTRTRKEDLPPDPPPSRILTHAVHGSAHDAVRHRARRAVRH